MVNNNSNSNTNNNNKNCQVCLGKKKSSKARCPRTNRACMAKTCKKCQNSIMATNPLCPTCRTNMRSPRQIRINRIPARAREQTRPTTLAQPPHRRFFHRRRAPLRVGGEPEYQPRGTAVRLHAGRAPAPDLVGAFQRMNLANAARRNRSRTPPNNRPLRERLENRSGRPSPTVTIPSSSNNNIPQMHTGGLVRKTGPHRLLKDEIVLSRAQRKGLTHGQIVKILKAYKKSK